MQREQNNGLSNEEDAESRAYRRIVDALEAAERLIDGVLAPGRQRLTLVRPSRDGRT